MSKKRVMIVTGAAQGLGYAATLELAKKNQTVVMVDLKEDALESAKADILKELPEADLMTIAADVSSEESVQNYVNKTVEAFGRIDGLYNNAGIEGKQAPLVEYDINTFKKVIDVNLMGLYYGIRYVVPVMQKQNYGRIVNVASVGGIRGVKNQTAYVATKHAVTGITKNTALEYAQDGILSNAIAPGVIVTPMVKEAFRQVNPDDPAKAEKESAAINPTKRFGEAHEVAKVVAFLLSEDCSYVNGQTIAIDGGQSSFYPV